MRRASILLSIGLAAWMAGSAYATTPAAEANALLQRLQASQCQFSRNGSWYTSAEAVAHLQRKLTYLQDKDLIKSTEDFIRLGASNSSMSGQPYWVKCGSMPPVQSATWLGEQLQTLRHSKP